MTGFGDHGCFHSRANTDGCGVGEATMALVADSTDRDGGCHGGRHSRRPMVVGFIMMNGKKRVFWRLFRV